MAIRDFHHDASQDVGGAFRLRDDSGEVRAECTRIARRLLAEGHRVVGLVPADDRTAVPPIAARLAAAVTELSAGTVGLVDANTCHPANRASPSQSERDSDHTLRWIGPSLALVTPARGLSPGAAVPELAQVLLDEGNDFGALLVDLTGFDRLGEHASAAACCDAVVVVARAHRTRERTLRSTIAALPGRQLLGVLLVG